MNIFNASHAKILYLRFCAIYGDKFVKPYHDEDFKSLWASEWSTGLAGIDTNFIKDSLEYCKKNLTWPPSIAEFRDVCERSSGVPTLEQVIDSCVRREFRHPVIVLAYEAVGSWAMKNDKEQDLKAKFKLAYADAINKFRENTEHTWLKLEEFNQKKLLELPAPSKIPSASESKAFRECMNKCQELLKGKKIAVGGKTYKQFDDNKIKKGHKEFDQAVFDEYRDYLMSIPETETMILPPVYLMERNKFLNMRDQSEWLRKQGYIPPNEREVNEQPRSGNNKTTRMYKNWSD